MTQPHCFAVIHFSISRQKKRPPGRWEPPWGPDPSTGEIIKEGGLGRISPLHRPCQPDIRH